jgi:hypothetical protein
MQCRITNHIEGRAKYLVNYTICEMTEKIRLKADFRLPVSMNLLKRLIQSLPFVCKSVYEFTMFASAFSLCFFGLLRVGEITSQNKGRAVNGVLVADKFYVGSVYDVLPGSTFILTSYFTNAEKSEKTQTERVRQHALDSNLYLHFDGSDLMRYQFSFVLQRALSFCEVK